MLRSSNHLDQGRQEQEERGLLVGSSLDIASILSDCAGAHEKVNV
jgi:hypothetical protein